MLSQVAATAASQAIEGQVDVQQVDRDTLRKKLIDDGYVLATVSK